jgi:hypothetical protein
VAAPPPVLINGAQILTSEISAIPNVVFTCAPIDLSTPVVASRRSSSRSCRRRARLTTRCANDSATGRFRLKYYLVLAHDRRLVQIHTRAGDLWRKRFVSEGALELDDPARDWPLPERKQSYSASQIEIETVAASGEAYSRFVTMFWGLEADSARS